MRMSSSIAAALVACAAVFSLLPVPAWAAGDKASAEIKDGSGKSLGTAEIQATPAGALIKLKLAGLPPGPHAIHVHETGTCEGNFASAGAIYNPLFRVMARFVFGYEATMTAYLTAAEKRLARP